MNIERASKLSGKIHDKGVFILTGLLNSLLGQDHPLGLAASICFEQSYGMIDGDSATLAEFVAILSALSGVPVKQGVAMTGSLNQFGEVQPIGGVNEKVEGFWKTCSILGSPKAKFSCLVPKQNVANLMLSKEARTAVQAGRLEVVPVGSIVEAFELATGHPLGIAEVRTFVPGKFARGSALEKAAKRLDEIHLKRLKERSKIGRRATGKKSVPVNSSRRK
jgi:predicted ATP-dependent protease